MRVGFIRQDLQDESEEASEMRIRGLLKGPREAGCPDGIIGTNVGASSQKNQLAYSCGSRFPHVPFKRSTSSCPSRPSRFCLFSVVIFLVFVCLRSSAVN